MFIKIVRIFFTLAAGVLFIIAMSFLLTGSFMGYRVFRIASGSMEPTLNVQDSCLFKEIEGKEDLKIDGIYVYRAQGKDICHRLVKINSDGTYVFKGDANKFEDAPTTIDKISYVYIDKFDQSVMVVYLCAFALLYGGIELVYALTKKMLE